jgi:hypothetical protein
MIIRVDSLFACHVDLDNLGYVGTPVNDRWLPDEHLATVFDKARAIAELMDRSGYHSLWLAEHHFQPGGYEVMPRWRRGGRRRGLGGHPHLAGDTSSPWARNQAGRQPDRLLHHLDRRQRGGCDPRGDTVLRGERQDIRPARLREGPDAGAD